MRFHTKGVGAGADRNQHGISGRDERRPVVNVKGARGAGEQQIYGRFPFDLLQPLRSDGGKSGVLRVMSVTTPGDRGSLRAEAAGEGCAEYEGSISVVCEKEVHQKAFSDQLSQFRRSFG